MNEQELIDAIQEAKSQYLENAGEITQVEIANHTEIIKGLQKQLGNLLSDGADPCPICKNQPHGMLKTPGTIKHGAIEKLPIYEVGCTICAPYLEQDQIVSFSSRGNSPETAIENWNNKLYVTTPKPKKS